MTEQTRPSGVGGGPGGANHRGRPGKQEICVSEELKIAVDVAIERFRMNEDLKGKCNSIREIF